ncbi:MAG TPA: hypothetical protein VEA41_21525 [Salinarimonas sp.]|nr:hypothetical protein [Salinarimonas sp.]
MAEILRFPGHTRCDLPPEQVLDAAKETGLEHVVIAARTKDGEDYFASSYGDNAKTLWLLKQCERVVLLPRKEE